MDELWGEFAAVPERNITALKGGERFEGFRVEYTPGPRDPPRDLRARGDRRRLRRRRGRHPDHPEHHTYAPTPPPDIDIPAWLESLELVRGFDPAALCLTHFGRFDDVNAQLDASAHTSSVGASPSRTRRPSSARSWARPVDAVGAEDAATYFQAAPPDQIWWGLKRYWEQQAE